MYLVLEKAWTNNQELRRFSYRERSHDGNDAQFAPGQGLGLHDFHIRGHLLHANTEHPVVLKQVDMSSVPGRVLRVRNSGDPKNFFFFRQPQTPAAWFPIVVEWGPGTRRGLESARVD